MYIGDRLDKTRINLKLYFRSDSLDSRTSFFKIYVETKKILCPKAPIGPILSKNGNKFSTTEDIYFCC